VYKNNVNDTVFIHVARYHEQKNQGLLIQVFNKLYQIRKDFVLLIIGDWDHDTNAQKLLSEACEVIHYLGTKGNVADYLYLANAFCLTSVYEGMPISLLEALACGCVPISTPAGGVVDVITDGETGYICRNITENDYLHSIEYYLDHKFRISRASLVELFDNNYSIEIAVQNHLSLFEH
jgi:glycosyltransferase involved in cell wall biosynthesis